jgi:hypothetical protein
MFRITHDDLLVVFRDPSPLSRRKIRNRLARPPHAVLSRVLFDAVKKGVIRRVNPIEVGSGKHIVHTYVPVKA